MMMTILENLPLLAEAVASTSDAARTSPVALLTIFVMAIYVGVEVITKIPPTLHTPLMSGSNAISGITIIGAILAAGQGNDIFLKILGSVAIAFAMINVVGGFLVTHRMLGMFIKKK
jgi:NAD(P) transhydrogenase subunit alpha